jgi:hypothetical protein
LHRCDAHGKNLCEKNIQQPIVELTLNHLALKEKEELVNADIIIKKMIDLQVFMYPLSDI